LRQSHFKGDKRMANCTPLGLARLTSSNIHYKYYPFEYFLDTQASLGFRNIELYLRPPHVWIDWQKSEDMATLRQELEKHGLSAPVLRPECDSQRYMLCAADSERLRRSVIYFEHCLDAAVELGAELLSVNASGAYQDELYKVAFARAVEQIGDLCRKAASRGLKIALESFCPKDSIIDNSLAEIKKLIDAVDHPALIATLDTVSMSEAGETIPQWFEVLDGKIGYIRLSDGRAGSGHYIWGTGIYPLERYLAQIEDCSYKGLFSLHLTLENYFQDPKQVDQQNRDALARFLGQQEGEYR